MTNVALTPIALTPDSSFTNVTAGNGNLTALSGNTTFSFPNTGTCFIVLVNGATSATVQTNVGTTVLGQSVAAFTAATVPSSATGIYGPFHSADNAPGTNTVTVTLTTPTTLTAACIQVPGVY